MIGLSGAQGVGKTTLCDAYALKTGVPFVKTSASRVFERLGLDPRVDYPFEQRLRIQQEILVEFVNLWTEAGSSGAFITDRTPIDLLAYLMADIQRETLTEETNAAFEAYSKACIDITNRMFGTLIVVQPGIKPREAGFEGKAPSISGYVEHIHSVIVGLIASEFVTCKHFYMPRSTTDLVKRVEAVEWAVRRSMELHQLAMNGLGAVSIH